MSRIGAVVGTVATPAREGPSASRDPVVAWVGGEAVFFSEVDAERRAWGGSVLGARLGLGEEPGAPRPTSPAAGGARPSPRGDPSTSSSAGVGTSVGPSGRSGAPAASVTDRTGPLEVGPLEVGPARVGSHRPDPLDLFVAKVLVARRCLALAAARLGVPPDAPRGRWLEALTARGEVGSLEPTDAQLERLLRARGTTSTGSARRVRHVLRPAKEEAQSVRGVIEVLARLAGGAGFSRPSRRRRSESDPSGDPGTADWVTAGMRGAFDICARVLSADRGSRPLGGVLGWVRRGELVGPLEEAIFSARLGELVGPTASCFGWHVLLVEAERPLGQPVPDRDVLRREARREQARQAWALWWEREVARQVVMAPGFEHPRQAGLPGSTHRH